MSATITFVSGPRAERALDLLQKLAESTDQDLSKKECIHVLTVNSLPEFADDIKKMTKDEFDDFCSNNLY